MQQGHDGINSQRGVVFKLGLFILLPETLVFNLDSNLCSATPIVITDLPAKECYSTFLFQQEKQEFWNPKQN